MEPAEAEGAEEGEDALGGIADQATLEAGDDEPASTRKPAWMTRSYNTAYINKICNGGENYFLITVYNNPTYNYLHQAFYMSPTRVQHCPSSISLSGEQAPLALINQSKNAVSKVFAEIVPATKKAPLKAVLQGGASKKARLKAGLQGKAAKVPPPIKAGSPEGSAGIEDVDLNDVVEAITKKAMAQRALMKLLAGADEEWAAVKAAREAEAVPAKTFNNPKVLGEREGYVCVQPTASFLATASSELLQPNTVGQINTQDRETAMALSHGLLPDNPTDADLKRLLEQCELWGECMKDPVVQNSNGSSSKSVDFHRLLLPFCFCLTML